MAWTYSADDLATGTASGQLNVVRLLIGDTDTSDQQVQDAEVEFALAQSNANVYSAGAWCAKAIASKYARKVTTQLDGALSVDYSDLQTHYNALASTLEDQARLNGARLGVFAGGINKTTMETVRNSTTRPVPSFRRDRFRIDPTDDRTDFNYE
jgi:hypothetical protein